MKRLFDIGFSLIGITLFSPLWLLLSLLIKLEDREEIVFKQKRIGKNKNTFEILKFRTMRNGKVTKIGGYLRKTGLDETLQFINVLKGDMSIIGPRPLTESDIQRLAWTGDHHAVRWLIRPGISGPAQIFGAGSAAVSLEMDLQYIKVQSTRKDLYFLVLSFMVNILGKSRVRKML